MTSVVIPRSVKLGFLKRYFRLGRQWTYHSLTDRVYGMVTDVLGQKSDKKNPGLRDQGTATDIKKPGPGD